MKRWSLLLVALPVLWVAQPAAADTCRNGRSPEGAMWLSFLHPGLGEWHLNGYGSFARNAPQKKFWLGFIPLYGWPGYLQVKSMIDARHCRTHDDI